MGRLTTHVLDTSAGEPARGLRIELLRHGEAATRLRDVRTNDDGRVDEPLLSGSELEPGRYELRFHVGDYFRARGVALPGIAFLDIVPVLFGIADARAHYHVPLLISPYGYATYRGS